MMVFQKFSLVTIAIILLFTIGNNHKFVAQVNSSINQLDSESISKTIISEGKPNAGVTVNYQFPNIVNPGKVFEVELTLTTHNNSGELQVEVRPENLEIINQPINLVFNLASGREHKFTVLIYPIETGRAYLNLFISEHNTNSHLRQQVLSLPFQIGGSLNQQKTGTSLVQDPENKALRVMPAQEIIIQNTK